MLPLFGRECNGGRMSFINKFIKGQVIDVIEWLDSTNDTLVYRYDRNSKDIMMGAQLTVRESQLAVFVNEGEIADVFTPGRYELSTQNMPILTTLKSWKFGFNSPFKAEVYFINTKQFRDVKWGTSNPVMMRDAEFGMIRIRVFGSLSFKVADPVKLLQEVVGTNSVFSVSQLSDQLKRTVVSNLSDIIAESKIPALDLAANYDELSHVAVERLRAKVENLGIYLVDVIIENISLPEEVEKTMDRRTSMGVVGNIDQYAKFQTAEAIRESANNPGNPFAGMGVGLGAANMMGNMFNQATQVPQQTSAPAAAQQGSKFCSNCGNPVVPEAKFCANCGNKL